ncbi:MAG: glycosyltransferase family 2 protein [Fimbriimonadaceae bacterium]|nr:glycosyltransferase family 2 protein [Fimbriimonadaceae bacterium]
MRIQTLPTAGTALVSSGPSKPILSVIVAEPIQAPTSWQASLQQQGIEVLTVQVKGSRAECLNEAAKKAEGEFLFFAPFGGWCDASTLIALKNDMESIPTLAAIACPVALPNGHTITNGFSIIEDHFNRMPLSSIPADQPTQGLASVSAFRPDCVLVRKQAFWGAGGWDTEVSEDLLGLALGVAIKGLLWQIGVRGDMLFHTSPTSPTCSGEASDVGGYQDFVRKYYGTFIPDNIRTADGVSRIHPGRFGFWRYANQASSAVSAENWETLAHRKPTDGTCSIVVVTYNSMKTIEACVHSVVANLGLFDELIIVDNGSRDGTPEFLKQLTGIGNRVKVILSDKNLGFSGGTNLGIENSKGDFIVLLNPDTAVTPGWLGKLVEHFADPTVGAVGPTSDCVAGFQKAEFHAPVQATGGFNYDRFAEMLGQVNSRRAIETKLLIGFAMMIRRSALDKVGLLDNDLFLGMDDLDISWRLRLAGYRLLIATDVFVHHDGHVSFDSEPSQLVQKLNQESTDALGRKLIEHYGKGQVPGQYELWGIDWFTPTFDVWAA